MEFPDTTRKYTPEEKAQLLANLDIELEHRTRQFQEWLADTVENFRIHAEGIISRIPKQVRNMTMAEFADKYNGDIQAASIGLQRDRATAETDEIAKSVRKRKWEAQLDMEGGEGSKNASEAESSRAAKSARLINATPKKKAGPSKGQGTAQRLKAHMLKTPVAARLNSHAPSPSPTKATRFASATTTILSSANPHPLRSRPASPTKPVASSSRPNRPPVSAAFNPSIPSTPRWPRKDEQFLSVNGSPLANPWLDTGDPEDKMEGSSKDSGASRSLKRMNSITVLNNSFSFSQRSGTHSQSNSQTSNMLPPSATQSSSRPTHTQTNSAGSSQSGPNYSSQHDAMSTPVPGRALISVPIRDGRMLEFDPLQTSPGMLEALEGISESAKKQAKEDMMKLVKAAMDKWTIQ